MLGANEAFESVKKLWQEHLKLYKIIFIGGNDVQKLYETSQKIRKYISEQNKNLEKEIMIVVIQGSSDDGKIQEQIDNRGINIVIKKPLNNQQIKTILEKNFIK